VLDMGSHSAMPCITPRMIVSSRRSKCFCHRHWFGLGLNG
jgi:hypothetical protein